MLADFKWARRGFDRKFYAHPRVGSGTARRVCDVPRQAGVGKLVPGTELGVSEIMAVDGDALREMWRFIFGVDLIKRITTRSQAAPTSR